MLQIKYILEALSESLGAEGKEGPMAQYVLDGVAALIEDAEVSLNNIYDAPLIRRLHKARTAALRPEAQS